jgi:hypothetical protein
MVRCVRYHGEIENPGYIALVPIEVQMLTNEFGLEIPNMRLQDMESEKITPGEAGEPADPGDVKEDEEDEDEDDEKSSDGDDVDDEGDENEDEDEDDQDDPDELKVDSANS